MTTQPIRTRRQFLVSSAGRLGVGAAAVAAVLGSTEATGLGDGEIEGSAGALEQAARLQLEVTTGAGIVPADGSLVFPVDPTGGDLVMPNGFGGYSNANGNGEHRGVDIGNGCSVGRGRPLLACVDGVLDSEKFLTGAGRLRVLRGDDGNYYRYHHLDAYETTIDVGDAVVAGQVIGYMGSTGNTQWSHLHFEVWIGGISPQRGGVAIDPQPLLPLPIDGVTVGGPDC